MKLFMITNCVDMAAFAIASGVDRIFVDTEIIGKDARQGHLSTVISRHTLDDVRRIRSVVPEGRLLVRINPIHEGSEAEIDLAIEAGADVLMLPMFRCVEEVELFTAAVGGRARCNLLVETVSAAANLKACVDVPGVDEVHIGLNDLHLELGLDFMFEPLASGVVDSMAEILRGSGKPFGIGGIARVGEGLLPAELLLAEHVRLGSTAAILSRTFHRQASSVSEIRKQMDFPAELGKLKSAFQRSKSYDSETLQANHRDVQEKVKLIVESIRARRLK
ncbi:aldolase/citrate lyase family protein [Pseudomonas sp. PDM13]|uniref:aldolase/citrate lyase family protein n=1 Tax=Pseudomonas sp. PDM13 TaxID=2769255 RepID=UPI0021DFE675|nr:aldolase/citrate lyase family protein [Pseudomonas sp. PDM13]MCU9951385.1 aldolase/citrate lyase family protein [Pseudomonas sp. PDM13]